jgi:palmitoyltransferase ZDHHC9/14/18
MASRDASSSNFLHSTNTDQSTFPNPHLAPSDIGDGVSVLSSRMTDIASEDGENTGSLSNPISQSRRQSHRQSYQTADGTSRPGTGVTGVTAVSSRGTFGQAAVSTRKGYTPGTIAQRGSIGGQPPSAATRTHVPSLTSQAFFRPMSSQRLQAQRGGSRTPTVVQQGYGEDGSLDGGSVRQSVNSNITIPQQTVREDADMPAPPSRGTEITELGTVDRGTANTSPTHGHAAGSFTDSVRPLQRGPANTKGLSLNIDKTYKNGSSTPKSPRSFHSNFLMPTRNDGPAGSPSPHRSNHGREKLSSVASSPGMTPTDAQKKAMQVQNLGKNHQYFTGNTVFCWGGRLQNTRHKPINIATGLLVLVPSILFFVFSAPWLWHHISPAVPILYGYIFYICMTSFIHASVSDPGVSSCNSLPPPGN